MRVLFSMAAVSPRIIIWVTYLWEWKWKDVGRRMFIWSFLRYRKCNALGRCIHNLFHHYGAVFVVTYAFLGIDTYQ